MQTDYKKTPEGKDLVRLFNNTQGSFIHEILLADGTKVKYTLAGKTFARVPKEVAAHWLKAFPSRVVTDSEAHETANAARAELETARTELEVSAKRIADLEAQLAATKKKPSGSKDRDEPKGSDAV